MVIFCHFCIIEAQNLLVSCVTFLSFRQMFV